MQALIVEDDLPLQSFYHQVLQQYDFDVHIAVDGQQAIAKLHNIRPSLIILDIRLPYVDGTHILDYIAEDDCLRKAFVLIASASQEFEQEVSKVANATFLLKPVLPDQIHEIVQLLQEHGEIDCD
ncbi:MAG: response regulator [Anaerolineae bacterium]|nr:response regulator [Anaerolineae bacterium]MDQ7033709.1 response regulator [Anaerolineae bacterium]